MKKYLIAGLLAAGITALPQPLYACNGSGEEAYLRNRERTAGEPRVVLQEQAGLDYGPLQGSCGGDKSEGVPRYVVRVRVEERDNREIYTISLREGDTAGTVLASLQKVLPGATLEQLVRENRLGRRLPRKPTLHYTIRE